MPSNWLIFDRIRALVKRHNIYNADRIYQNQTDINKLMIGSGREFLGSGIGHDLLEQTNLQISRLERYKEYEMMDQTGEISLALDLYADEASLVDPEYKHTILLRAKTRRIKSELENLFFNNLMWDSFCRSVVRYLCKYGDAPLEIITTADRDGVAGVKFMNVYNFTRVETRFGDLVGFFYQDQYMNAPEFLHPWQVAHMRLTSFENLYYPYGRSIIDGSRKPWRQLRLMEDAALIYRIVRAPERRKYIIPVGNIPAKEIPEYMLSIARLFKRQRFYNPTTATFDERYSPLTQEDDFFLPRRPDGSGPDIDTLPGAENLDQIADIEYFKKKMISPLKIPFERVGLGDNAGGYSEKSLSQSHSEFAKAIQWIQREVAISLKKIAIVHLALRGYPVDVLSSFDISLSATSALEELYRIETWQTRVNVIADLKDLGWFPKEWIVTRFTDLSPDEIEEINRYVELENEVEDDGTGGGGGLGGLGDLEDVEVGDENIEDIDLEEPEEAEEGLDTRGANKLIVEDAKIRNDQHRRLLIEKWAAENNEIMNGLDYLINNNELDGLPKQDSGMILVEGCETYDNVMFGQVLDTSEKTDAYREVHDILMSVSEDDEEDSDEVTEQDINNLDKQN